MATLYNQYIYKNGAWMKIGTSSDSITYALSYSALTGLLTLTGSNGSTSTVTINSGSSDAITGITVNGTTVTVTDGVAAISIPTNVSAFTNDAGYLTSYTETDPVFSASAAAGITATDISNWNNKVSDDKTWNGVRLDTTVVSMSNNSCRIPFMWDINGETTARIVKASKTPTASNLVLYDSNAYLNSTTPSSDDSSTKVATTAFVKTALSALTADDISVSNSPLSFDYTGNTYTVATAQDEFEALVTEMTTAQTNITALDDNKSYAGQGIYSGESLDDCRTAGWYYIDPSTTTANNPVTSWGILEVIRTSGNNAGAVLQRFTAVDDGITYTRSSDANETGSFTEWYKS